MKIKEIFYTLQGEGRNWGMPAVFVRVGDCNLRCTFCDTDFLTDLKEMTPGEVADEVVKIAGSCRNVVFTGGEPLLQQVDLAEVMGLLSDMDEWYFAVETNGTVAITCEEFSFWIDWICCSPKVPIQMIKLDRAHELKIVFTAVQRWWAKPYEEFPAQFFYITPEAPSANPYARNDADRSAWPGLAGVQTIVEFVKENPKWRLNLQSHKILGLR